MKKLTKRNHLVFLLTLLFIALSCATVILAAIALQKMWTSSKGHVIKSTIPKIEPLLKITTHPDLKNEITTKKLFSIQYKDMNYSPKEDESDLITVPHRVSIDPEKWNTFTTNQKKDFFKNKYLDIQYKIYLVKNNQKVSDKGVISSDNILSDDLKIMDSKDETSVILKSDTKEDDLFLVNFEYKKKQKPDDPLTFLNHKEPDLLKLYEQPSTSTDYTKDRPVLMIEDKDNISLQYYDIFINIQQNADLDKELLKQIVESLNSKDSVNIDDYSEGRFKIIVDYALMNKDGQIGGITSTDLSGKKSPRLAKSKNNASSASRSPVKVNVRITDQNSQKISN